MTSTFTPNINLQLQATGDNSNSWGTILNSNVFTNIDTALGGALAVTMTGSDVTLSSSQALNLVYNITGTLSTNVNLIFPASVGRVVIINNGTSGSFTITVKSSGGTGVVVPQGFRSFVNIDPSNNTAYIPNGYLTSALAAGNVFIGNGSGVATAQAISGAITINTSGSASLAANIVLGTNLGTNVVTNTNLALMAPLTIKGNSGTSTANAADNSLSVYMDAFLGTSQGSITYRGTSTWGALTAGTSGQLLQTGGANANPSWTNAPASGVFTKSYDSGFTALAANNTYTLAHSLGASPKILQFFGQCNTAELGYNQNDVISLLPGLNDNNANGGGFSVRIDSTNIYIRTGSVGWEIINNTNGNNARITVANWSWKVTAYA